MNKRTLRRLLKWSFPVNGALFLLALLDYFLWDSRGMLVVLPVYALFLIGVLILLVIDETPHYQRLELPAGGDGPKTIIYGRR